MQFQNVFPSIFDCGFYAFYQHERNVIRNGQIDRLSKKEENLVKCVDLRLKAQLKAYFDSRKWMLIEWYQLSTKGFKNRLQ